jgi:nucleoid-associated protein YgaU
MDMTAREAAGQAPRRRGRQQRRIACRRGLRGLGRLALVIAAVLITVWAGVCVADAASNSPTYSEHTYVVRAGDTLWSVASRSYSGSHNPRQLVFLIEQRNHLANADIRPGEVLILPIL